jgi:hypothetical protein
VIVSYDATGGPDKADDWQKKLAEFGKAETNAAPNAR